MTSLPPPGPATPAPAAGARHLVVMGVSGTGKTSVATRLADRLGRVFIEGDDLHPASNVAKMSAGVPLDDEDRAPWLAAIRDALAAHDAADDLTVLTCSSLKRAYRDVLREGVPDGSVLFVHLAASFDVLWERMRSRQHFMPPSLLQSQFDTLEPLGADEAGVVIDVAQPLEDVVGEVLAALPR